MLTALLTGAAEVPPADSGATGEAVVVVNAERTEMSYRITYQGLSSPLHTAAFCIGWSTDDVVCPFIGPELPLGPSPLVGTRAVGLPQNWESGQAWVQLITVAYPQGEIRGLLVPAPDGSAPVPSDTPVDPTPTPAATPAPSMPRSLTPTIGTTPPNDDPPGTAITAIPFNDTVNTRLAQIHAMEGTSTCGSGSHSVWYSLTATADQNLVADTLGSDYDTIIDIWEGTLSSDPMNPGFEALRPLACNDNSGDLLQSEVVFAARSGQSYVIRVSAALDAPGGTLTFHLSAA